MKSVGKQDLLGSDEQAIATFASIVPSWPSIEIERLAQYASTHWGVQSHVLPYNLVIENLHHSVRDSALSYFDNHSIKWWRRDKEIRPYDAPSLPTGHLNSSQVACVNHLERARVDRSIADHIVSSVLSEGRAVAMNDGYVEYEWIGIEPYLGERGARIRGANVTSLDAVMCAEQHGRRHLIAIEWKYTESYGAESVARSTRGTDRIEIYRPLLEQADNPVSVADLEWLFYEPYCQLMRQTLLAWQMVEHGEFDAEEWIHIVVVPGGNSALLESRSAPMLYGSTMVEKWRSALREPSRFGWVTPTQLLVGLIVEGDTVNWRTWLAERYNT